MFSFNIQQHLSSYFNKQRNWLNWNSIMMQCIFVLEIKRLYNKLPLVRYPSNKNAKSRCRESVFLLCFPHFDSLHLKDMDTEKTSWSVNIPYFLPNHVVIFVFLLFFFLQKSHGSSKMGCYPFLVISLNGHNSSQEQDRDMAQETFFVQNNMLKICLDIIFSFWQKNWPIPLEYWQKFFFVKMKK